MGLGVRFSNVLLEVVLHAGLMYIERAQEVLGL